MLPAASPATALGASSATGAASSPPKRRNNSSSTKRSSWRSYSVQVFGAGSNVDNALLCCRTGPPPGKRPPSCRSIYPKKVSNSRRSRVAKSASGDALTAASPSAAFRGSPPELLPSRSAGHAKAKWRKPFDTTAWPASLYWVTKPRWKHASSELWRACWMLYARPTMAGSLKRRASQRSSGEVEAQRRFTASAAAAWEAIPRRAFAPRRTAALPCDGIPALPPTRARSPQRAGRLWPNA
mmetsp:Transcript_45208/g.131550  ORF Transcript_45208/g.131550 Transcript_45208/m.131550 type:complete len:240 (-) Transcript_45208:4-723(-)